MHAWPGSIAFQRLLTDEGLHALDATFKAWLSERAPDIHADLEAIRAGAFDQGAYPTWLTRGTTA